MIKHKGQEGFSLIELLIVVAIIGIIASIAIPSLLASRRAANEASAKSSLRTISSCEATYLATDGGGNYGDLAELGAHTLTDVVLSSGSKGGYKFVVTPVTGATAEFWAYGIPETASGVGQTGTRRFAIAEDGVLRGDGTLTAPADYDAVNPGMPAIGN